MPDDDDSSKVNYQMVCTIIVSGGSQRKEREVAMINNTREPYLLKKVTGIK